MNDTIYKKIFASIKKGLIITDQSLNILDCNDWIVAFTKKQRDYFIGQRIYDVIPRFDNPSLHKIFTNVLTSGHEMFLSGSLHKNFILPDNYDPKKDEIRQNLTVQRFMVDEQVYILIQVENITTQHVRIKNLNKTIMEKQKKEEVIQKMIHADPLTKLYNRRYLSNALEELITKNKPFAAIFIDLDQFKQLNDDFGHFYGDIYLREFANRLKEVFTDYDEVVLSRYAGDEFFILLPGISNINEMLPVITDLIDNAEDPIVISDKPFLIRYSAGIFVHSAEKETQTPLTKSQVLKFADQAMYQAKKRTNNQSVDYSFYSET